MLGFSLLAGWGFGVNSPQDSNGISIAIIVCLCLFVAGEIMFGIDFKQKRESVMLKIAAGIWGFCVLVMNMSFLGVAASITTVFIANGVSLLLFLLLAHSIYKA